MKRFLLFAALIVWSGMAGAVVYKWVDAKGEVQYGDRPPDGVHAELVEMLGTRAAHVASERAPEPARTSRAAAAKSPQDEADKKAVDSDVAQTKEKQCADAQDRYKKLIEGRRLYKTGADGERQYLTSEEIDTQRLDAKRDLDTICNGPN